MTESPGSREQEISRAMKQLAADYQQRRLSLPTYRRLRRTLLENAGQGNGITPGPGEKVPDRARPGMVVWLAATVIALLLVLVGWLLR